MEDGVLAHLLVCGKSREGEAGCKTSRKTERKAGGGALQKEEENGENVQVLQADFELSPEARELPGPAATIDAGRPLLYRSTFLTVVSYSEGTLKRQSANTFNQ